MLVIAKTKDKELGVLPEMACRHIGIFGATGTGKTRSLQVLVEQASINNIPTILADVKGDIMGLSQTGESNDKIAERCKRLGIKRFTFQNFPVRVWSVGKDKDKGIPIRVSIKKLGPDLLSKLLELSEIQCGTMLQVYKIASDKCWPLITIEDLKAVLNYVLENSKELEREGYGRIALMSVGAIQRAILGLESEGDQNMFGTPEIDINDLLSTSGGYGVINVIDATTLIKTPRIYSTLMCWIMLELNNLSEVGDLPKPRGLFVIDEAHTLFSDNTSRTILSKIETTLRLIRSKSISVTFVSQCPTDLPRNVLGQLSNRIQHALRAFTVSQHKDVKASAQTLCSNPNIKNTEVEKIITSLSVGECLASFLDSTGAPTPVERAWVYPCRSRMGTITDEERALLKSPLYVKYNKTDVGKESTAAIIKRKQPVQQYSKSRQKEETPLGVQLFNTLIKSRSSKGLVGKLLKMF